MTFSTTQDIARAAAPTSSLMETPAHLEALVHKPLRRVDWGNKKNQLKETKRREKLRKIERRVNYNKVREQKDGEYLFSPFRMKRLVSVFCRVLRINHKYLISKTREKDITANRQIMMWILTKNTCQSLPMIARELGRTNHTTVIHAVRRITNDPDMHKEALDIEKRVLFFEHETYGDGE